MLKWIGGMLMKLKKRVTRLIATMVICVFTALPVMAEDIPDNSLNFYEEKVNTDTLPLETEKAVETETPSIEPRINWDGSFTFYTSGIGGATLVSSEFKFIKNFGRVIISSWGGDADKLIVYLEKEVGLIWTTVKSVEFPRSGGFYDYTGLSTSAKYRLRFYAPGGTADGSGALTNYQKI